MNSFFDGVPSHDTYDYYNYNLLDEITYSLFAVDTNSNSRISDVFGKSFMMRYAMNLIGEAHSPLNNINRYSSKHPSGDNNGRLHSISISSNSIKDYLCMTGLCSFYNISSPKATSNLHDYWGSSFGMFGMIAYPIKSTTTV